jgi:hypothetical protein
MPADQAATVITGHDPVDSFSTTGPPEVARREAAANWGGITTLLVP